MEAACVPTPGFRLCYDCLVAEPGYSHVVPCAEHFLHVCRIMLPHVCYAGQLAVSSYHNYSD
jgi:hypothetical protein